jgi:general secretion pathway protein I
MRAERPARPPATGFTLLEVLIGLAVLALALVALTRTAASQVADFAALRERTYAGWLAADVLAQTRLATPFPPLGKSDGRRRYADRDWRYELVVQSTPLPTLRRIEVRVYAEADRSAPLAELTGFGGRELSP